MQRSAAFKLNDSMLKAGFKVQMPWVAAWGDMDCFGHVNNTVYIRYFEHVRIEHFHAVKITADPNSASSSIKPILATISCKFKRAVTFPDDLVLGARVKALEASGGRFVLEHAVWSDKQQAICAIGDGIVVPFDYSKNEKAAMPDSWRENIVKLDAPEVVQNVSKL